MIRFTATAAFILFLSAGCSNMLPLAKSTDNSPWENFEQVKSAYDRITPFTSTQADLKSLGFDPYLTPQHPDPQLPGHHRKIHAQHQHHQG